MKNFIPHLREQGLSPQQWRVLRALFEAVESGEGEVEMKVLAGRCYLLLPSLSRIAQNLEKRQLIGRRTSETDLRCSMISIKEAGIELVNIMSPQSEARYEHITKVFGYGKLELLYELLDELTASLTEAEKEAAQASRNETAAIEKETK